MRLWSLHPEYLDSKGLVALWREGLLAQNVLLGKTRGYRNHPQLSRFKSSEASVTAIASYLHSVVDEADKRGYNFNREKVLHRGEHGLIEVTSGQLEYEFTHLLGKLKVRDPIRLEKLGLVSEINVHPLFVRVEGEIEEWEVVHV